MIKDVEGEIHDFIIKNTEVKLKNNDILGNPYNKTSHLFFDQEKDAQKLLQEYAHLLTESQHWSCMM